MGRSAAYKMVGGLTRPHSTSSPPPNYSASPLTPFPPFAGVLLRPARIEVRFPPAFPFPQLCVLRRLISDSVALLLLCFSPRHAGSCLLGWWVSWLLLRCGFFSASLAFLAHPQSLQLLFFFDMVVGAVAARGSFLVDFRAGVLRLCFFPVSWSSLP